MATRTTRGWSTYIRLKCFIIAYMHLIASLADIACHIAVVAILSYGFQCDVTETAMKKVDWPWLEPLFLFINVGTHGFYPFPVILRSPDNVFSNYLGPISEPRCYPGMLHVGLFDILSLILNVIWLKFVKEFVVGVHKRDPKPIRRFIAIATMKLSLQILQFIYQTELHIARNEAVWFIKLFDVAVTFIFLLVVYIHMKQLQVEQRLDQQPPPYVSYIFSQSEANPEKKVPIETEANLPKEEDKININV